jgi:hypothetical protein
MVRLTSMEFVKVNETLIAGYGHSHITEWLNLYVLQWFKGTTTSSQHIMTENNHFQ